MLEGTFDEATKETGEPSHGAPTVWFAFEPTRTQRVAIAMPYRSGAPPVFDVFTGDRLGALRLVGWAGFWSHTLLRVPFEAIAGRTYRIAAGVDDAPPPLDPGSRYQLRIDRAPLPPNDAFASPRVLRVRGVVRGNLGDATSEPGEARLVGERSSHTLWFRIDAARSGELTVDTTGSNCGPGIDVAVTTGTNLATARVVAAGNVAVAFDAAQGRRYRVAVDCRGTSTGHYVLRLRDASIVGKGVSLKVDGGQSVASVQAQGLQLVVGADRDVRMRVRLVVSARTARRLGLRTRVLGSSGSWVARGERLPIVIRLTRAADRALSGATRLRAAVQLAVFPRRAPDRTLAAPVRLPN